MNFSSVVSIKGFQWKLEKGTVVSLPKFSNVNEGDLLHFDKVLYLQDLDSGELKFGFPYVSGMKISARVLDPMKKGDKVVVFKHKRAKRYRRKRGYRSQYTIVKIEEALVD